MRIEKKEIKCNKKKKNISLKNFIENIKIYLYDYRYVKINNNPIIGIYNPLKIKKIDEVIFNWRKKSREFGIGEIFIIADINIKKFKKYKFKNKLFNGIYYFPKDSSEIKILVKNKKYFYYSGLIYENKLNLINIKRDHNIFRGSMIEWDNSPNKKDDYFIFNEYSPEKFYILNKIIIKWTKIHKNKNNRIFFINSWNNWIEGSYLEPDDIYGYASINALSKALFNLPYKKINYNLLNLNKKKIVVQAHIYYEDLIKEIINKTNNIKIDFDLYITTTSISKKKIIENYIKKNSNVHKYIIQITKNKGRDILPMLIQLKHIIKNYKYICHIHSKKTKFSKLGKEWRRYLYENLLGNNEIVSEILLDFENNNKLGFIFPETFYRIIILTFRTNKIIKKYMNLLLKKIFPGYKIKKNIDFPAGNMFWAKVDAIHQIYEQNLEKYCPEEINMSQNTILHAVERIWLYIVKLNGYYYKKIFKHY